MKSGAFQFLTGDPAADAAVPPSGVTGHLTVFAAAAMALVAVFVLMCVLAADRVADRWTGALSGSATIEITGAPAQAEADAARVEVILKQTPGITAARRQPRDTVVGYLEQWVPDVADLETLDLPVFLDVEEGPQLDRPALDARLKGEVPNAVYAAHTQAADRVAQAANRLRILAFVLLGITFCVTTTIVTLAARASLAMNRSVIETLRTLGAQDSYIARAFVRRFTLRGFFGALLGTFLGLAIALWLPIGPDDQILGGLRPGSLGEWLAALALPPVTGLFAFLATRRAAYRVLTRIR